MVRTMSFDDGPETTRVVQFLKVRQFVNDEIVEHFGRGHHDAPIEGHGTGRRTGAPLRALVTELHPFGPQAHLVASELNGVTEDAKCLVLHPVSDGLIDVSWGDSEQTRSIHRMPHLVTCDDFERLAAKGQGTRARFGGLLEEPKSPLFVEGQEFERDAAGSCEWQHHLELSVEDAEFRATCPLRPTHSGLEIQSAPSHDGRSPDCERRDAIREGRSHKNLRIIDKKDIRKGPGVQWTPGPLCCFLNQAAALTEFWLLIGLLQLPFLPLLLIQQAR